MDRETNPSEKPHIRVFQVLIFEHRQFARLLRGLERFKTPAKVAGELVHLGELIRLQMALLQQWHYGKEQGLLWPVVRGCTGHQCRGLVSRLEVQHLEVLSLCDVLRSLSNRGRPWNDAECGLVSTASARLVELFTLHMHLEEQHLFPAILASLGTADRDSLNSDFQKWCEAHPFQDRAIRLIDEVLRK